MEISFKLTVADPGSLVWCGAIIFGTIMSYTMKLEIFK